MDWPRYINDRVSFKTKRLGRYPRLFFETCLEAINEMLTPEIMHAFNSGNLDMTEMLNHMHDKMSVQYKLFKSACLRANKDNKNISEDSDYINTIDFDLLPPEIQSQYAEVIQIVLDHIRQERLAAAFENVHLHHQS
jgi:hypothetical protein